MIVLLSKRNTSTSQWGPSVNPRYRRPPRAVPSFETKEVFHSSVFLLHVTYQELPPLVISEVQYETETKTVTQTSYVPSPSATRVVAFPTPEAVEMPPTTSIPRTTAVEYITEEDVPVMVRARPTARQAPAKWFPGW